MNKVQLAKFEPDDGLYHIPETQTANLPATASLLLEALPGPSVVHVRGLKRTCRVITTLVHGDERCSLHAILSLLRSGEPPATDIKIIIIAVEAAKTPPLFSQPLWRGKQDLNRCFRPPFIDQQGHPACAINAYLQRLSPDSVVNIQDSQKSEKMLALAAVHDEKVETLSALFTHNLVYSPISVGAITDLDLHCPIVSIHAPASPLSDNQHLHNGLLRYWTSPSLKNRICDDNS